MEFTKSLIKGKLVKRYKRFFADIKVNKEIITAHCPNTGSMMGLLDKNNDVWVSKNDDPKRKLKYTLEIIKVKKIVLDPVMIAKGGTKLIDDKSINFLREKMMKKAILITPNIPEAEILTKTKISNKEDMIFAANELLNTTLQSFGLPQEALQALQSFSQSLNNLVQGLSSIDITPQVQFTGAVDVNVKGVEGMTAAAKDIVNSAIHNALNRLKEANSGANMEIPGTSEDFTNGG